MKQGHVHHGIEVDCRLAEMLVREYSMPFDYGSCWEVVLGEHCIDHPCN